VVPTREEIVGILDGNICRCTGYRYILESPSQCVAQLSFSRPIWDAFLSFNDDPAEPSEIEELVTKQGRLKCPKTNKACSGKCSPKGKDGVCYNTFFTYILNLTI